MVRQFSNEDPIHRAQQAWQILVSAAHNRQTFTYLQLALAIFGESHRHLTHIPLSTVAAFRQREGLPQLTALMVSEDEQYLGIPAEGIQRFVSRAEVNAERERVYGHNWYGLIVPTGSELAAE